MDVSNNLQLELPDADFLKLSAVNDLNLRGCKVVKTAIMRQRERNGVKEYEERHKKRHDQAVTNHLDANYKLFGLD